MVRLSRYGLLLSVSLLLFFLCPPQTIQAGERTNTVGYLSLDLCIEQALAHAQTVGLLDSNIALANAGYRRARAQSRPQLHLTPRLRTYLDSSGDTELDMGVELGEHLLDIPQNIVRRRLARARIQQANQKALYAYNRYATQAVRAYLKTDEACGAHRLAALRYSAARADREAWADITVDEPALRDRRALAILDASHAEEALRDAVIIRTQAMGHLRDLCGLDNTDVALAPLPAYQFPPIDLERCLAWSNTNRSDLAAVRTEVRAMSNAVRLARYGRLPRARLGLGYDSGGEDLGGEDDPEGVFAMVQLTIPFWDAGQTRARIEEATARRDALASNLPTLERQVEQAVVTAFVQCRAASQAAERLRAVSAQKRTYEEAAARHAAGDMSKTEFTAATLAWETHVEERHAADRACYESEARLCEAIQATRQQLAAGLVSEAGAMTE